MRCHPKLCSSGGYDQGTSPIVWQESKVLTPARQLCTRANLIWKFRRFPFVSLRALEISAYLCL